MFKAVTVYKVLKTPFKVTSRGGGHQRRETYKMSAARGLQVSPLGMCEDDTSCPFGRLLLAYTYPVLLFLSVFVSLVFLFLEVSLVFFCWVSNPPLANPGVAERAPWRSSQSGVAGGQQPIENPYRFLSFLLHTWQPSLDTNSHSWGRPFQLPGG